MNLVAVHRAGAALGGGAAAAAGAPRAGVRWPGRRPGGAAAGGRSALVALCLAVWVLVQDLGFFGGLGTDPNSMVPIAAGRGRRTGSRRAAAAELPAGQPGHRAPAPAERGEVRRRAPAAPAEAVRGPRAPGRLAAAAGPATLAESFGTAGDPRPILSASAVGVIVLGAFPMAAAQASPSASPILAESIDGASAPLHTPAPAFALTDQDGRR